MNGHVVRLLLCTAAALALPVALGAQAAPSDSVIYLLAPSSRFEVKTGKAGFFGFMGHEHLIRARTLSGRVVVYPEAPTRSRVEILVAAESLEVLTPPDTAEIRKVTASMRTAVLRVDSFPEIRFVSTEVRPVSGGFQIVGDFTLAGQTHPVTVDMQTTIGPDTLRAAGSFSVKQTDFGITPYRGGPGGSVKVADRVGIRIEAIAVRALEP